MEVDDFHGATEDTLLVMVTDKPSDSASAVYDYRLKAPVQEHVLDEVRQLVEDLVYSSVARLGGFQPALF